MERSYSKSTVSRRARILEELEVKGQVSVTGLSKMFEISEVTIRNDLAHLERQNMLIRARGGAIKIKFNRMEIDPSGSENQKEFLREKQLIAQAAVKLINDGDTIVLDSGSTTTEIAKNLEKFTNLTIITNALNIASILAEYEGFHIFMPGGSLRKKSLSLVGVLADENFAKILLRQVIPGSGRFRHHARTVHARLGRGAPQPDHDQDIQKSDCRCRFKKIYQETLRVYWYTVACRYGHYRRGDPGRR